MAPPTNQTSSIAMALAGKTASVDIPKPREASSLVGTETFATVAARSLSTTNKQSGMLPTPPNSISPSLPPQVFKSNSVETPLTPPTIASHAESDIDLQDAVEHAKAQDQTHRGLTLAQETGHLGGFDAAGTLTPSLLAKHHLPTILLSHGPLAIRHIMGFLTTTVPGFSGIPPAKARRLVVGALEGRGNGVERGGIEGEVEFEKVGWGRWDAKIRGQERSLERTVLNGHCDEDSREHHQSLPLPNNPPGFAHTIPISNARQNRAGSLLYSRNPDNNPSHLSPESDMDYGDAYDDRVEDEADKMSLDGSCSSSEAPPGNGQPLDEGDEDTGDATDSEDWASIGAAALRKATLSVPHGIRGQNYPIRGRPSNIHTAANPYPKCSRGGGLARETIAKSMPTHGDLGNRVRQRMNRGVRDRNLSMAFGDEATGAQERAAVEALLSLGSV